MSGYRCSSHIGKILIFMCQCFIPKCMLFILWTKRQCFNVATGVKVTINMCAYSYLSKICAPTRICLKYECLLVFAKNMCAYSYLSKIYAPTHICLKYVRLLVFVKNMCTYSYLSKICAPTRICPKYVRLLVFV